MSCADCPVASVTLEGVMLNVAVPVPPVPPMLVMSGLLRVSQPAAISNAATAVRRRGLVRMAADWSTLRARAQVPEEPAWRPPVVRP